MIEKEDDGTLDYLQIPHDEKSRSFNCDEITQSKLVNTILKTLPYEIKFNN